MKYFELKNKIIELFEKNGIDEPSDADWIMVEVLGVSRSMLPFVQNISDSDVLKIMDIAKKRAEHVPIAYIFGKTNFFGRDFKVNENCLIPRLDTEILVEEAIKCIKKKNQVVSVLDIGTGSGAIAITIASETSAKVTAVDVSKKALEIAEENAKANNANVKFVLSDLYENIKGERFDLIVSNPPYIETGVIETLDREVASHEPILALDGGEDGLNFYRRIIQDAKFHLNPHGMIFFEIGYNQSQSVRKLLEKDFENIKVVKDYGGNTRVVFAELREI
jgi:release factor glutamine methyltransferase